MAAVYDIQESLSILAGQGTPPWQEAQKAANVWAGTTGLDLIAALNVKNGTTGLDLNGVCQALSGLAGREAQVCLSYLAGGGWN